MCNSVVKFNHHIEMKPERPTEMQIDVLTMVDWFMVTHNLGIAWLFICYEGRSLFVFPADHINGFCPANQQLKKLSGA